MSRVTQNLHIVFIPSTGHGSSFMGRNRACGNATRDTVSLLSPKLESEFQFHDMLLTKKVAYLLKYKKCGACSINTRHKTSNTPLADMSTLRSCSQYISLEYDPVQMS